MLWISWLLARYNGGNEKTQKRNYFEPGLRPAPKPQKTRRPAGTDRYAIRCNAALYAQIHGLDFSITQYGLYAEGKPN